jgi:hypothetical protein
MRMGMAWLGLALTIVCGCVEPVADDGGAPQPDTGASDAGEPARACVDVAETPEIGVDRFCPSAHDYVGGVIGGELEGPGAYSFCGDGAITPDAGPDSGCAPADHGWSIVQSCDAWTVCETGGEPCYHCPEWDEP